MEDRKGMSWETSSVVTKPVAVTNYRGEIAELLADYRIHGRKEASEHRPPSDALTMDQYETALQSVAEKWLADEQRLFEAVVTETNRAAIDVRQKVVELSARIEQILSDDSLRSTMDADMAGERQALVSVTEERLRRQVELRAFRAANGITDQASYPESVVWHYGLVALLAVIETLVNAFFYENDQGLLGGFFVALGVAAVNMAGALALGIGFRFKNLRSLDKKLLGWSCLALFIVLTVYCNALFASFRSEYQLLRDPSDLLELRRAFASSLSEAKRIFVLDMQVADLMSFILLGIGLLLSGLAFYKGYTADDKYPGHGAKDKAVKAAQQLEQQQQEQLRQKVKDFLHRRRAEVQSLINEPAQLIQRASSRAGDLEHWEATLINQTQAIQRDFELVMRAYRAANMSVRATKPPSHFELMPDLLNRTSLTAAKSTAATLAAVQDEVKQLRERYQQQLHTKLSNMQADSAAILHQHMDKFLKEVEDEACDRIDRASPTLARAA